MPRFFDKKIGQAKRARVVDTPGSVPGLRGSVTMPGATSLGGTTVEAMQKYSGSFALPRPEGLVGYTGGWTYSHANMPGVHPVGRPLMPGLGG